jgi:nitroreductase
MQIATTPTEKRTRHTTHAAPAIAAAILPDDAPSVAAARETASTATAKAAKAIESIETAKAAVAAAEAKWLEDPSDDNRAAVARTNEDARLAHLMSTKCARDAATADELVTDVRNVAAFEYIDARFGVNGATPDRFAAIATPIVDKLVAAYVALADLEGELESVRSTAVTAANNAAIEATALGVGANIRGPSRDQVLALVADRLTERLAAIGVRNIAPPYAHGVSDELLGVVGRVRYTAVRR